jgi:glycosyltransferase involved in cell wall biosynthesis
VSTMPSLQTEAEDYVGEYDAPLVSICIPTFNAARWMRECLTSALAQSYQRIEILIVDDASTDNTVELVESLRDERTRVIVNELNLGMVNNWNKCIELARGKFIKFLFQDDVLYPDCVEQMMRLFLAHENLGLVASERDIIVEGDTEQKATQEWLKNSSLLHQRFDSARTVNNGRELFVQYLRKGFQGNWIGEPSSVLIRKECFLRLGLFNTNLYQVCDIEMWLRIMFRYDVGLLSEKLSAFRFHSDSTSASNIKSRRNCLDQLWLLEGLSSEPEVRLAYPEIERIRGIELLRLVKAFFRSPFAVWRCLRTDPVGRRGFLLLPTWTKSAAGYALSTPLRPGAASR